MKRMLALLVMFAIAAPAVASAVMYGHFPMESEMAWIYDDGSAMKIVGFAKLTMQQEPGSQEIMEARAFKFSTYNNEARAFFNMRGRLFEYRDGYRRLWYDFNAAEGDSWELEWTLVRAGGREDTGQTPEKTAAGDGGTSSGDGSGDGTGAGESGERMGSDSFNGVTMEVVSRNAAVDTPAGRFEECIQFRLTRPDGGIVEEWFARDVGLVQRVSAVGDRKYMQRLRQHIRSDFENLSYRMMVETDKEVYTEGEPIQITVSVLNPSGQELTLEFPSSLQVNYQIDNTYDWAEGRAFTQATTSVTIPAGDVHTWEFTHTADDALIGPGQHGITALLMGTRLAARTAFTVLPGVPDLPAGLELSAAVDKETYDIGEPVTATLTVTNTTGEAIPLEVSSVHPMRIEIRGLYRFPGLLWRNDEKETVTVPAGGSQTFTETINADRQFLKPGYYVITLGLTGYAGSASAKFNVEYTVSFGTLTGAMVTRDESGAEVPLAGVEIMLKPVVPRTYRAELMDVSSIAPDILTAESGDDGAFVVESVTLGQFYNLHARKEGYVPVNRTVRLLSETADITIPVRPVTEIPEEPMNYKDRETSNGLMVAFGTDRSAYQPASDFRAFVKVTNVNEETVQFTFAGTETVELTLTDRQGDAVWTSAPPEKAAATLEQTVDIGPGETHVFSYAGNFDGIVPAGPAKYVLTGSLAYDTCSLETATREQLTGWVRIVIVPAEQERMRAEAHNREMIVDARERTRARLEFRMKDDNVGGEVNISEIRENIHGEISGKRFVKMVEVDADDEIRTRMEHCLVRIYYEEGDFPDGFDPSGLVVGHWHESMSLDTDSEPAWEMLQTRVNTLEKYVEAETTQFSSFAIFEDGTSTGVADEPKPAEWALGQNSPNPFNPVTTISFTLAEAGNAELVVYNVMGQVVERLVSRNMPAGSHRVTFNGASLASGVYFYRLTTPGFTHTRKMLLIK